MVESLSLRWFKRKGWKFVGSFPKNIERCVVVISPVTKWIDYVLLIVNNKLQPYKVTPVFGKGQKLPPIWIRPFIPYIDNTSGKLKTDDLQALFNKEEKLFLGFFLENTATDNWDPTFYDLAKKGRHPIVLLTFDFRHKWIKYHFPFRNSMDKDRDLAFMKRFFTTNSGKVAQKEVFV